MFTYVVNLVADRGNLSIVLSTWIQI